MHDNNITIVVIMTWAYSMARRISINDNYSICMALCGTTDFTLFIANIDLETAEHRTST